MNACENLRNLLLKRPFERAGFHDHVWPDTLRRWIDEGYPCHEGQPEDPSQRFGFDIVMFGGIDPMPMRGSDEVLEETETWVVRRNGAGAVQRTWKHRSGAPEHLAFGMTSRDVWDREYRHLLVDPDPARIAFDSISDAFKKARRQGLFVCAHNSFLWENMRSMLGDVCMLEGMALDPAWIKDYNRTYTDFYKTHYRLIFKEIGLPDGTSISEDLAYNKGLLCSPALLEELYLPYWRELTDFFHSHNLPVTIHSDGDISAALDIFVEAGFDAINPLEAKAGCDALRIAEQHHDRLTFKGALDARVLESGDRDLIRREVTRLIDGMKRLGAGYIFGSDHSVSARVAYQDYAHAVEVFKEHRCY